MKIFIVEDNTNIAQSMAEELRKWQYEVYQVDDFNQVLAEFKTIQPHLVLLDINLPSFNGYHWCGQIRQISNVPIIIISSRNEQMDMVMAMQMGADDFIVKPFDMTVTIAKIQALLRRTYDFTDNLDLLTMDKLTLFLGQARLVWEEQTVDLTRTELQVMESLMLAKGQFVARESLMEKCWQNDSFIDDNTLAVNVTRLRKKLATLTPDYQIISKRNVGYALKQETL
ncbi:response regulator transcription factor [Vaginisenegalia massiliensis]|uniref:response regulator transcription factor n=1 Tax=Vaginisenegalia massiliensis TaxID=2058294 RepID=UPI000F51B53D|nr:response regulator transcription factor [Vaginisenegalia massiliensis]